MKHYKVKITEILSESKYVYNHYKFVGVAEGKSPQLYCIPQTRRYRPDGDLTKVKVGDTLHLRASKKKHSAMWLVFCFWFEHTADDLKGYIAPQVSSEVERSFSTLPITLRESGVLPKKISSKER